MQQVIAMRATDLLNHPHNGAHHKRQGYHYQKDVCIGRIIGQGHRLHTSIENHKTNEQNKVANQAIYFRILHIQNIKKTRDKKFSRLSSVGP